MPLGWMAASEWGVDEVRVRKWGLIRRTGSSAHRGEETPGGDPGWFKVHMGDITTRQSGSKVQVAPLLVTSGRMRVSRGAYTCRSANRLRVTSVFIAMRALRVVGAEETQEQCDNFVRGLLRNEVSAR